MKFARTERKIVRFYFQYIFSRCPCNIVLHCFKQHWICWQISNGGIFIPIHSKATKNGMLVTMKKFIFAQYCDNAESSNISYTFLQCMDKTPKREHHPYNLLNPLRRSMVFYLILLQVAGTVHQRSLNFTCWLITSWRRMWSFITWTWGR